MDFFGISFLELLVLAVLAFILFGPEKLPEYAEKAGRLMARLRQATSELSQQYQKPLQEAKESFRGAAFPSVPPIPPSPQEFFQEIACPQCSQRVDKNFQFCPGCGNKLPKEEPAPSPYPPGEDIACPQCRQMAPPDYSFCPHCGQRLPRRG